MKHYRRGDPETGIVLIMAGVLLAIVVAVLLVVSRARGGEPIEGIASTWSGPGAAVPDCIYPWTHCAPRLVVSLKTGVGIVVIPQQYCLCEVPGSPHPHRLIDLDPSQVRALGLDPADGLFNVSVQLVDGSTGLPMIPNTSIR